MVPYIVYVNPKAVERFMGAPLPSNRRKNPASP